jgi:hypothetical protein
MRSNAVLVRVTLLVFIGLGAIAFCVQAACSSGTAIGPGYGYSP